LTVRSFDWRDVPALHRYRHQSVFLHNALVLTQGPFLLSGALLSSISPATGIFTSVCPGRGRSSRPLMGQVLHPTGMQLAQLTFLAPRDALDMDDDPLAVLALLDHLVTQVGERGAHRLLADVDEGSPVFEVLRRVSFAIYARQRIWRLQRLGRHNNSHAYHWQAATERDLIAVRSLYNNIVPGLVQQVEPFPAERLNGLIYRQEDELLAYVELKYGPRGIWAQPFVHPDAEEIAPCLVDLFQNLPYRRSRPVYVCIRSYQSWLELALEDMGAEAGPRQAVMVKHLAVPLKAARPFALPALEGGHPEISAPIMHIEGGNSVNYDS